MKTEQIMVRTFRDGEIRQNHKTNWFNATDLIKLGNEYRSQIGLKPRLIADYFKTDNTKEFVKIILDRENLTKAYETKKGKNGGTWVHPLILVDIAMWLNPDFKYDALKWVNDELTKNRDLSGDSYKKLASYIKSRDDIPIAKIGIILPKIAKYIKQCLKVDDWNKATEKQLKQRDEIHKNFIMLCKANVELNIALKLATETAINDI